MGEAMGNMGAMGAVGGAAAVVTVLKYILITLGGGLALGLVGGFVYAGLKYPNPNKKQMFSTVQKIIVMVIALLGVALVVFAFVKKPKPKDDMMVDGNGMSIVAGDIDADGNPIDTQGNLVDESAGDQADGEASTSEGESPADGEESASDGESSSEASSSESSSTAPPVATPDVGNYIMGGGGGVVMARPMM